MQNHPETVSQLKNILRKKTKDVAVKKYAIELMKNAGAFTYTLDYLKMLETKAFEEIQRLGGNPLLEAIIRRLSVTDG